MPPLEQPGVTFTLGQGADITGGMARGFEMGQAMKQQRDNAQIRSIMQGSDLSTPEGQTQAAQKISAINPQLGMNMMTQVREQQQMKITQQHYQELAAERRDALQERQKEAALKQQQQIAAAADKRLDAYERGTLPMIEDYEKTRDDYIKSGKNPKDAEIFAQQKVNADWGAWRTGLAEEKDAEGNPLFNPQQMGAVPEKFDYGAAKQLLARTKQGQTQLQQWRQQQQKAAEEAAKREEKPPVTRNVIYGDRERTEEFDPKTGQWKPIGEMGPRFAGQVEGASKGQVFRSQSTGDTYVMDKSGKTRKLEDDGTYSEVPASQVPKDLVKPGVAGAAGGRESVFTGRVITSANEALKDLQNVSELPLTASTGLFGGRHQGPGIIDAGKEVLLNKLTTQEVQDYNVTAAGFQRSLAGIESSGLAPAGSLSHQMDAVMFKEGDSNLTKMRKLAQTRQIVEAGLEPLLENPRLTEGQKKEVKGIIDGLQKAVPFTQHDVTMLERAQQRNPQTTLRDVMPKSGKDATAIPASPPQGRQPAPDAALAALKANPGKKDDFLKKFGYLPKEFQ